MNDSVRTFLINVARDDKKRVDAEGLTLADIQSGAAPDLDRDDIKPLREIVAAMLGLKPVGHDWAAEYGRYTKDTAARDSLALLVKRTRLLANELKTGAADLKPSDKVRVDKVLDIASGRGWLPLPAVSPDVAGETVAVDATRGMTLAALKDQHRHEWLTIDRDTKGASKNGLARSAKIGSRGWNEANAIEWARLNGKLQRSAQRGQQLPPAWPPGPAGRKHTIKD
jgi:hypothetical protein